MQIRSIWGHAARGETRGCSQAPSTPGRLGYNKQALAYFSLMERNCNRDIEMRMPIGMMPTLNSVQDETFRFQELLQASRVAGSATQAFARTVTVASI